MLRPPPTSTLFPYTTLFRSGIVIGPREILTTADAMDDRTLVRVQRGGRGKWWNADVKWVDFPANLAVVTSAEEPFWAGLKSVPLAEPVKKSEDIQVLRWRPGHPEVL